MIFHRSRPPRNYSDYTLFRPLLRQDFRYRCAYCLRHEYFLGGEAGCCIDHYRPVNGPYARAALRQKFLARLQRGVDFGTEPLPSREERYADRLRRF